MKNVFYVQRLLSPLGSINPFSFGGGLRNGGLSPEATDLIKDIFSFDYMGAAEFEFGALPKALETLYKCKTLIHFTIEKDNKPLYVICPEDMKDELTVWLATCENLSLKEGLDFSSPNILGWIKIERDNRCDEPFMFFKDEEMFIKTAKLFKLM